MNNNMDINNALREIISLQRKVYDLTIENTKLLELVDSLLEKPENWNLLKLKQQMELCEFLLKNNRITNDE